MKFETVALRGSRAASSSDLEHILKGAATTLATDLRFPLHVVGDSAERVAVLSERRTLPQSLVGALSYLEGAIGDFVVAHVRTPQPTCGFTTKPVEPVNVSNVEGLVWETHKRLDTIYQSFEPTDHAALSYRSIVVDVRSRLKRFLLEVNMKDTEHGLSALERPAFLADCIALENYLGQIVQKVEGVRLEIEGGEGPQN